MTCRSRSSTRATASSERRSRTSPVTRERLAAPLQFRTAESLDITVTDDGRGFDTSTRARHRSLVDGAEHVAELGGTFDIAPGTAGGTEVRRVPCSASRSPREPRCESSSSTTTRCSGKV